MRQLWIIALVAASLFSSVRAQGELSLYNWPSYIPPELLQRFERETGIRVSVDIYDSEETLLAMLRAGATGHDVVVPSDHLVRTLIDEGLVLRIDVAEMANFANVAYHHTDPAYDPQRHYSAPYMWGTTGLSYDSAKLDEPLAESWEVFFNPPEALQGQIAALNSPMEVYSAAAYYLGLSKCPEGLDDARRVLALLEAQKPYLAGYYSEDTVKRLVSGEVIMHQIWSGRYHRARRQLSTLVYLYPQEGVSLWGDNLMVPRGAPHLENARLFINWMMAPENIAEASNFTGYMNAIAGSDAYLDESLKNDPAVNMPEKYLVRLRPSESCSTASEALRERVWVRLQG